MGRQKTTIFASLGRGHPCEGQAFFDKYLSIRNCMAASSCCRQNAKAAALISQSRKSGGSDFSKPPLFIGHSHDFSNAKPITIGKLPVCYRLCVCASGSMIDVFNSRTLINISCLHLGQYSGNLSRTVSSYTFIRVFPPQAGQHIQ